MSCVDVGASVAFVIWMAKCPAWKSTKGKRRRTIVFHKLGQELETPHIRRRAEIPVLRTSIQIAINTLGVNPAAALGIQIQRPVGKKTKMQTLPT